MMKIDVYCGRRWRKRQTCATSRALPSSAALNNLLAAPSWKPRANFTLNHDILSLKLCVTSQLKSSWKLFHLFRYIDQNGGTI